jgi:hypothetical protein
LIKNLRLILENLLSIADQVTNKNNVNPFNVYYSTKIKNISYKQKAASEMMQLLLKTFLQEETRIELLNNQFLGR